MGETGSFSLDSNLFSLRSDPQRQRQTNELPQDTEILCTKGSNHGMRDLQNMSGIPTTSRNETNILINRWARDWNTHSNTRSPKARYQETG